MARKHIKVWVDLVYKPRGGIYRQLYVPLTVYRTSRVDSDLFKLPLIYSLLIPPTPLAGWSDKACAS